MEKLILRPDSASYGVDFGTGVSVSEVEGGASRYRADSAMSPHRVTCQWTLDPLEYTYIVAFFNGYANTGATAFLIDLAVDEQALQERTAHFVKNSFKLNSFSGLTYSVSAQLELEPVSNEFASATAYLLQQIIEGGGSVSTLFELDEFFEYVMNEQIADI